MSITSEHRELLSLLERVEIDGFPVTIGGRPVVEVVRELIEAPRLPTDLVPMIEALAEVRRADMDYDAAREAKDAADLRLAEVVGTRRRDKDMSFDAEFDAHRILEQAAIEAVSGDRDEPSGQA